MPPREFKPGLPTYYLDTSTLSHAFRGVPPELARLKAWLETLSAKVNFCLSFAHVAEFGDWPDWRPFAEWLETLDYVWLRSTQDAEPFEVEVALKMSLGIRTSSTIWPFAHKTEGIIQTIEVGRAHGWQPLKSLPFTLTMMAREDAAHVTAEGVSPDELEKHRTYGCRHLIRNLAREGHHRLVERGDAEYLTAQIGESVLDNVVALFDRDPSTFRILRMSNAAIAELSRRAAGRDPGSGKELGQLEGAAGDATHAIYGAVYSDVFTCDRFTAQWVAPMRRQFGLRPPIVLAKHKGGPAGFAAELMTELGRKE